MKLQRDSCYVCEYTSASKHLNCVRGNLPCMRSQNGCGFSEPFCAGRSSSTMISLTLGKDVRLVIYRAHVIDKDFQLYGPDRMEVVANKHAPGIWDILLGSKTRTDEQRDPENIEKQSKKVVTIMYDLADAR
uniref:Uncharacterized protein n=1 Tax=Branchiostoma floridae TaxID=7739 RepID=C3YY82_BRAFL|eukprot:XP_002598689.1 hypothetical protein BRAFLDRAFT_107181 [Branchiostoma floridae]